MDKGQTAREKVTTDGITAVLKRYPTWVSWYRPVPGVYGGRYLDYIGCANGLHFVIEAKRPGKEPTPHQWDRLREAYAAGSAIFVIDGSDELQYHALDHWLRCAIADRGWAADNRPSVHFPDRPKILATPT